MGVTDKYGVGKKPWAESDKMLRHVAGAILFGVPSRGMETQALMILVRGHANEAIVRDLIVGSGYLQSLDDRFFDVASHGRMTLFWAFETRTSPPVGREWALPRGGPGMSACQPTAGGEAGPPIARKVN